MEKNRNPTSEKQDKEFYYKLEIMMLKAKLLVAQHPELANAKIRCKNRKVEQRYGSKHFQENSNTEKR